MEPNGEPNEQPGERVLVVDRYAVLADLLSGIARYLENVNRNPTEEELATKRVGLLKGFKDIYDTHGQTFFNCFRRHHYFEYCRCNRLDMRDGMGFLDETTIDFELKCFENMLLEQNDPVWHAKYEIFFISIAVELGSRVADAKKMGMVEPPKDWNEWKDNIIKKIVTFNEKFEVFHLWFRKFIIKAYYCLVRGEEYDKKIEAPETWEQRENEWDDMMEMVNAVHYSEYCGIMYAATDCWLRSFQVTMERLPFEHFSRLRELRVEEPDEDDFCKYFRPIKPVVKEAVEPAKEVPKSEFAMSPLAVVMGPLPNRVNGFSKFVKREPRLAWGVTDKTAMSRNPIPSFKHLIIAENPK